MNCEDCTYYRVYFTENGWADDEGCNHEELESNMRDYWPGACSEDGRRCPYFEPAEGGCG